MISLPLALALSSLSSPISILFDLFTLRSVSLSLSLSVYIHIMSRDGFKPDLQRTQASPDLQTTQIVRLQGQTYCGHTREKFTFFPDIHTNSCLNLILRHPILRFLIPKVIESGKSSPILSASVKLVVKLSSKFIPRLVFACLTEFLRKY
ncbi:unnamed protein product [Camellia sinensis]